MLNSYIRCVCSVSCKCNNGSTSFETVSVSTLASKANACYLMMYQICLPKGGISELISL